MEREYEHSQELWVWRLPVVGQIGKRAIGLLGSQQALENIRSQIEEEQGQEEMVLEASFSFADSDMLPLQARSLAAIRAKRLVKHILDDLEDVPERLANLKRTMDAYPEDCQLDRLGLDIDETELLRIKLKEVE